MFVSWRERKCRTIVVLDDELGYFATDFFCPYTGGGISIAHEYLIRGNKHIGKNLAKYVLFEMRKYLRLKCKQSTSRHYTDWQDSYIPDHSLYDDWNAIKQERDEYLVKYLLVE